MDIIRIPLAPSPAGQAMTDNTAHPPAAAQPLAAAQAEKTPAGVPPVDFSTVSPSAAAQKASDAVPPSPPRDPARKNTIALGFFDGMHRGHAALLSAALTLAAESGTVPAAFTFADHAALKPGRARLFSEEERLARLSAAGMARLFLADFPALRDKDVGAFARLLAVDCCAAAVVCGFDFRCGRGAAAGPAELSAALAPYGVSLRTLPTVRTPDGRPVSASRVRAAMEEGQPEEAAAVLGRPFSLTGPVLHGHALGRTLAFPTANLAFPPGGVLPARGVYAVAVAPGVALTLPPAPLVGMANVGVRPTVADGTGPNCEVHLFDFSGDLYGKTLTVFFLHRLRPERRFPDTDALRAQLTTDKQMIKEYFRTWENGQN